MNDPIQFAKQVAELVRDQVTRATAPLLERLATLESRPEPLIPKDGTSVTVEDVLPALLAAIPDPVPGPPGDSVTIEQVLAAIPTPKDGGSVTLEEVLAALAPRVDEALAAIPAPKDGTSVTLDEVLAAIPTPKDGTSVTLNEVLAAITARVDEALDAIPTPKDGTSVSLDDVKGLVESNMAGWALDFERRAQDLLQRVADKMPTPKDGRDATSLDDIDLVLADDGRTVTLRFLGGDQVREKSIKLATIIDRGVFKRGEAYEPGDAVSWGGSLWVAQADTGDAPEESRDGKPWRLAVKKGQNGKDLRPDDAKGAEVYRLRGRGA